ncbi:hypothetical protein FOL47_001258 [Perkinsus chesapeaki]|uniref:Integrase catalytic domain-containing protein n=1 Tax=Perkinsus chesapeaki TaxID=330153 RepID=A0A7J6KT09_PERCH|nr:hypothetical protein FOL47_001258 [Perkinsus chesapeaki]
MNHIRVVGPTPNRRTNDNKSNTLSDSTPGFMLTPKEFEYVRANRICFSFAKYGSCNRDECAFKHVSQSQVKEAVASTPEVAGPLSTSKTSPSTDSTLTTHKVCHDSTEQKRTLRSYDLGDLFIEIDTGCSTSIISSHAFEVLSESNLVRDVVSVDQSFSTASGPNALHANKRAYVEISVYDINNVAHKLVWQPYVVNSVIPQCDGLFGKDVLLFGDRGLEILLADGAYDLALFWCSRTDVIECQFTSPVSSPDTSVSSLGEDGNDVLSDGAMTLQADIDVPDFTTTTYKLPDDPIDHVIYDGVWYRISVQRKGDGSRYFLCDFSTEFECAYLLDVRDAYMCIRCGEVMAKVLGLIINEPDLLGLHILPVKHALVGLLSHWRHMNDAKWDQPVPLTLFDLIREWLSLVALSPLPKYLDLIQIAGLGLHLQYVYVASKENPADADEDEILFNYIRPDYDFVPLALFDDDLPAPMYLSDLNGYITNIEIVDVTDPAQQLRLASIGHNVAHESDDIVCDRLRKFYRWPNMKATITKAAQLCEPCNRTKTRPNDCKFKQIPHVPRLVPIPFHKVGMDGLGPYGSVYVLTLTDYFTGYIMVRVTMGAPKTHDVRQLINHVYRVFGMFPRIVRSDNASIFQSAAKDFPGLWTFSPIHGSPSNGLAERRHRDINQKLRRLMLQGVAGTDLISWCDILDKVCGEMNNAPVKRAKGLSPTDVLMYYPCTNLLTGTNRQQDPDRHVVWSNYRADSLKTNAQRIAVAHQQLKIGQQVMARISQPNSKLSPRYNPAVITRILGPNRVELDNGSVVHSRDLKILQSLLVEEVEDDVEEE